MVRVIKCRGPRGVCGGRYGNLDRVEAATNAKAELGNNCLLRAEAMRLLRDPGCAGATPDSTNHMGTPPRRRANHSPSKHTGDS